MSILAEQSLDWRYAAACRSADPDLFFPVGLGVAAASQALEALSICSGCQVRRPCLEFATKTGQEGVWGGTTEDERQRVHRAELRRARRDGA